MKIQVLARFSNLTGNASRPFILHKPTAASKSSMPLSIRRKYKLLFLEKFFFFEMYTNFKTCYRTGKIRNIKGNAVPEDDSGAGKLLVTFPVGCKYTQEK